MKIAINLRKLFICMTCFLCMVVAFVFAGCANNNAKLTKNDYVLAVNTTIQKIDAVISTGATTKSIDISTTNYAKVSGDAARALKPLSAILKLVKNIYENEKYTITADTISFKIDFSDTDMSSKSDLLWKMRTTYKNGILSILIGIDDDKNSQTELYEAEIEYTFSSEAVGNFTLMHYLSDYESYKGIGNDVYKLESDSTTFSDEKQYYRNNAARIYNGLTVSSEPYDFTAEYKNAMGL